MNRISWTPLSICFALSLSNMYLKKQKNDSIKKLNLLKKTKVTPSFMSGQKYFLFLTRIRVEKTMKRFLLLMVKLSFFLKNYFGISYTSKWKLREPCGTVSRKKVVKLNFFECLFWFIINDGSDPFPDKSDYRRDENVKFIAFFNIGETFFMIWFFTELKLGSARVFTSPKSPKFLL